LHVARDLVQRTPISAGALQHGVKPPQASLREAAAHAADVNELPIVAVRGEHERTEPGARLARRGVSDDEKLRLLHALHFDPVLASPAAIPGIALLADDTFQPKAASFVENLGRASHEMIHVANR